MDNSITAIIATQCLVKHLEKEYAAYVDCCGEDDEINTLPTKRALENARFLLSYYNKQREKDESHN